MRVLQISNFYPPWMGGIQTVAWELTEGLNRAGVPTDVLCANSTSRTVHELSATGYRITRAGNWGLFLSAAIAPAMLRLLREWRTDYDVFHVHMPNPIAALALYGARPVGKVVVHWHSDVVRQRRALRFYEPLQSWLLARADAIVATSPNYLESSEALKPWRGKGQVIPIGISPLPAASAALSAAEIRHRVGGRRIVFALGRMIPYKGFDVLIDAAASLPPGCIVLLGGDGPLFEVHRRRIAAAGLSERVQMLGHVPPEHLPSYYEACDVFCLPSVVRSEAFGVCMVEAMAAGKPVVATDIAGSGVPWVNVHGSTGLIVPPGDTAALAEALRTLLEEPARARIMGEAARLRYREVLTAEAMVRSVVEMYRSLAGGSNPVTV